MESLIKGQTIILYEKKLVGEDNFGAGIYEETAVEVSNILIQPIDASAIISDIQIYGKHSVYTLHIPKCDEHEWEDVVVEFYGKKYRTFGPVLQYDENLTPLDWNKQIKVERYE